ncbi:MAG: hypothetical protein Q9214_002909 [Letrouitia sp. 1 TL-2023]
MDLKTRYVVKVVGKEQIISSKVNIFYDKDTGKITKVEDKWDGQLPDSSFRNVSLQKLFSPRWWAHYAEGWAWWTWSLTWETWWWQVFRNLNSVTVPNMVSVPKNDEEDAKRGNHNFPARLVFYPAYCFNLSPTYNTWVKLTAADVHRLTTTPGFKGTGCYGQDLYFVLNHPINYVRLVGVVVAFNVQETRYIITLDDSSGATIEVTCKRQAPKPTTNLYSFNAATAREALPPFGTNLDDGGGYGIAPSNNRIELGGIDIGSVVKVKGVVGEYRGEKQLMLERIFLIRTTTEEAAAWAEYSALHKKVLSKPWVVSKEEERRAKEMVCGSYHKKELRRRMQKKRKAKEEQGRAQVRDHKKRLRPEPTPSISKLDGAIAVRARRETREKRVGDVRHKKINLVERCRPAESKEFDALGL